MSEKSDLYNRIDQCNAEIAVIRSDIAGMENVACLLIFLDYSFAVEQPEAMIYLFQRLRSQVLVKNVFVIEQMSHLLFCHSTPVVGHRNLYIVVGRFASYRHVSATGGIFAGIVGQGVNHEKRQGFICFHYIVAGVDGKIDAFLLVSK